MAESSSSRLKSSIYVPFVYRFVSFLSNGADLLSPAAFNAAVSVCSQYTSIDGEYLSDDADFMTCCDESNVRERRKGSTV